MKLTLGKNIASLMAQQGLKKTSDALSKAYERLGSGMRINRASDDAAGLTIADSLNADSRVFTQGIRNINDGISLLTIAESAISELTGIVTRIRELATQSANGTFSNKQRESIDAEAQALSKEFTRIQQTAEFNGMGLLNGETSAIRIQAGYGTDGSIASGVGEFLGDGTFKAKNSFTVGNGPYSVTVGDFNGDGVLDIFTTDGNDSTASVLIGKGDGTFGAKKSFTVGGGPWSATTGDFNGDGVLDILTADSFDNTISVLLGNGDGSFQNRNYFSTGDSPRSVTTGDFNGDGVLDILTADFNDDTASVLLGRGDGTFQAKDSFTVGDQPKSVATGDFNGDGVLDLVTADSGTDDTASVLLGNGDGTFGAKNSFTVGLDPASVTTGDFNGDGVLDLVTADSNNATASVLLGNGDGTFQAKNSFTVGSGAYSVTTGDFNGDGVLDLVTADSGANTASVLLGIGDGSFQDRNYFSTGNLPCSVKTGDFNGDGVLDILTADFNDDTASVLLGNVREGVNPLLSFSLKTKSEALQAFGLLDRKLETLNQQRGQIGAFQSRLGFAANTLTSTVENYKAAESRIRDADIAEESANLIRLQILQQAGTAVLAQANQQPALAIQLLT